MCHPLPIRSCARYNLIRYSGAIIQWSLLFRLIDGSFTAEYISLSLSSSESQTTSLRPMANWARRVVLPYPASAWIYVRQLPGGAILSIRRGRRTVASGVVGIVRYSYDCWGVTVGSTEVWAVINDLIYLPDLTLASGGFCANSGISHTLLWRSAPSILPPSQRVCTLRWDIPHFSAASFGEIYFIVFGPLDHLNL